MAARCASRRSRFSWARWARRSCAWLSGSRHTSRPTTRPSATKPPSESPRRSRPSLASSRFLCGGAFGGRDGLEPLVRNRLAALDRDAVGAGRQPGLGALDGGQLLAQTFGQAFIELVLVEIAGEVARDELVGLLARVCVPKLPQRQLDSLPLRR